MSDELGVSEVFPMLTWQPIENAPRDGTEVMICSDLAGVGAARYVDQRHHRYPKPYWERTNSMQYIDQARLDPPTHWMPLPPPPGDPAWNARAGENELKGIVERALDKRINESHAEQIAGYHKSLETQRNRIMELTGRVADLEAARTELVEGLRRCHNSLDMFVCVSTDPGTEALAVLYCNHALMQKHAPHLVNKALNREQP